MEKVISLRVLSLKMRRYDDVDYSFSLGRYQRRVMVRVPVFEFEDRKIGK